MNDYLMPNSQKAFATLLRDFREEENLTQKEAYGFLKANGIQISFRTYQDYEDRARNYLPKQETIEKILQTINQYPHVDGEAFEEKIITPDLEEDQNEVYWSYVLDALWNTGKEVVLQAMAAARLTLMHPWKIHAVQTSVFKPSDAAVKDKTEPIDHAASVSMDLVLRKALKTPGHPLSEGFLFHQEEYGVIEVRNDQGKCNRDFIVFADPIDYTFAATKGLDGSVLITFVHAKYGVCATVIGDLFRNRLYMRKQGSKSVAFSLKYSQDPATLLVETGHQIELEIDNWVPLKPSKKKRLHQISLNMYMGRPGRVLAACEKAHQLLKTPGAVAEVFSTGGALGPVRVAEGLFNVSLEVAKGFRYWDFLPGAFICAGAGATIVDLKNQAINFNLPDLNLDQLNSKRQKFVCASNPQIAAQVVALL